MTGFKVRSLPILILALLVLGFSACGGTRGGSGGDDDDGASCFTDSDCIAGEEYCNNLILFLFGIVVTFAGVFLITFAKHEDSGRRGSGAGNREYLSREGSTHRDAELADAEREGLLSEAPFDTHSRLQIPPLLPSPRHQHDLAGRGAGPRFLASEL